MDDPKALSRVALRQVNCGLTCSLGCPVRTVIVDNENVKCIGTTLPQQRAHRSANSIDFITGGNDDDDRRNYFRWRQGLREQALDHPETPMPQQQVKPGHDA